MDILGKFTGKSAKSQEQVKADSVDVVQNPENVELQVAEKVEVSGDTDTVKADSVVDEVVEPNAEDNQQVDTKGFGQKSPSHGKSSAPQTMEEINALPPEDRVAALQKMLADAERQVELSDPNVAIRKMADKLRNFEVPVTVPRVKDGEEPYANIRWGGSIELTMTYNVETQQYTLTSVVTGKVLKCTKVERYIYEYLRTAPKRDKIIVNVEGKTDTDKVVTLTSANAEHTYFNTQKVQKKFAAIIAEHFEVLPNGAIVEVADSE